MKDKLAKKDTKRAEDAVYTNNLSMKALLDLIELGVILDIKIAKINPEDNRTYKATDK